MAPFVSDTLVVSMFYLLIVSTFDSKNYSLLSAGFGNKRKNATVVRRTAPPLQGAATGRSQRMRPRPVPGLLLALTNVTVHPSTTSVPTSYYSI